MSHPGFSDPASPALREHARADGAASRPSPDRTRLGDAIGWAVIAIAVIKAMALIEDSTPRFFMGDSASYLRSALTGAQPPDRSYTYGYLLLKPLAVWPASLTPVVVAQAAAAGMACVMAALVLIRSFDVRPALAVIAAIVCAADPLQLMLERLVLTESFALLGLALFVMMGAAYVRRPRIPTLAGTHAAGIALVSLRTLYVPATLASALVLPLLAWGSLPRMAASGSGPPGPARHRPRWAIVAGHLAVSAALAWGLHDGYKRMTGWLAGRPPAYQYQDGLFLVAMVAPILRPADAPTPGLGQIIEEMRPSLAHLDRRAVHRWSPVGLVGRLHREVGTQARLNAVSREIAWNAIRRDPGGLLALAGKTYAQYWEPVRRRNLARVDAGRLPLPWFIERMLRTDFGHLVAPRGHRPSFAQRYLEGASRLWIDAALLAPFVALVAPLVCRRQARPVALFVLVLAWSIAGVTFAVAGVPTLRYLHPFGLLICMTGTVVVDGLLSRRVATARGGS